MTICETSQALIQTVALVCFFASALLLFWALNPGWQQRYAEQIRGSGTVRPRPLARCLGYTLLFLGTAFGAAGIWGKLLFPWCGS